MNLNLKSKLDKFFNEKTPELKLIILNKFYREITLDKNERIIKK